MMKLLFLLLLLLSSLLQLLLPLSLPLLLLLGALRREGGIGDNNQRGSISVQVKPAVLADARLILQFGTCPLAD